MATEKVNSESSLRSRLRREKQVNGECVFVALAHFVLREK